MAENQGVNGDMWNDCALRLVKLFGWEHIGDKNIDLLGNDSKEYGIDALTCYDSPNLDVKQSCLIESKRYKMTSLNASTIKQWIERLRQKLDALYQCGNIQDDFPLLKECCSINLGIIFCWIHDAPNEHYFKTDFEKYLSKALITTMPKPYSYKRIMVLSNPRIVRLCAVAEITQKGNYRFIYPSQLINDRPLVRSKILSIEYAMSNIILAEKYENEKTTNVVFFLDSISIQAFFSVQEMLTMYNLLEKGKGITIYFYENRENNRTIIAEAKKCFKEIEVNFKQLTHYEISTEPSIIKNKEYDE